MRVLMIACMVPVVLLFVGCSKSNPTGGNGTHTYTLTVNATNGTVAKSPDLAAYDSNSVVQLTATPAAGYHFTGWSGDTTGTANPLNVRMNGNKNLTANFAINNVPPSGMVHITGGTFQMGDTNTSFPDEQPVHSVTVSAFYMDITDVTQADYQALMLVNPSFFTGDSLRPVEQVSWFDAVLYCNARSRRDLRDTVYSYTSKTMDSIWCTDLVSINIDYSKSGYRLPTEAEWEYACRAGSTTDFYWGKSYPPTTSVDTLAIDSNAVWYYNSPTGTQPVATKKPNAWGLYDMSGNVWEWCNDWYGSYSSGSQTDPTGPSTGSYRVLRGGSWGHDYSYGFNLRSAYRNFYIPDEGGGYNGFRCVRR